MTKCIRFIDLFAGIGGMRQGLENSCHQLGISSSCVFTSEIKKHAISTYQANFQDSNIYGDISKISTREIPDFDILLAGFPCQPFSTAGTRQGFLDTRGTLFFEIERVLEAKQPFGFILENVEGLVRHDKGKTLKTIINKLENLNYHVNWRVLNAKDFAIPQDRKRIYIVGNKNHPVSLEFFGEKTAKLKNILEKGKSTLQNKITEKILAHYPIEKLYGKAIKDKRGGNDNIHSWDIELKGLVSQPQKELLNQLLKERRRKIWAKVKGIKWMDGMPLTLKEILTFYNSIDLPESGNLQEMLDDLVEKGYLKYEHPKDLVETINSAGKRIKKREFRKDLPKGYNIIVGKLSFDISKILDPNGIAPTLVATDMGKLAVVDGEGIRKLTVREGLRLFGFPESYKIELPTSKAFDLLGNTVVINIIEEIATRIIIQKLISTPNQNYSLCPV